MSERIATKQEWTQVVAGSVESAAMQILKAVGPVEYGFSRMTMDDAREIALVLREYLYASTSPVSKNQMSTTKPDTKPV
ncbi:hypothetical protein [Rhizobium sp. Root1204]|uniref:hypothetical protein n=1 Tax=Rhizobium sp. Root1204 TaxID=1736428 RepID=UPI0012E39481|nr:hypothetical protein [Rhizobium sp. Root1204]